MMCSRVYCDLEWNFITYVVTIRLFKGHMLGVFKDKNVF